MWDFKTRLLLRRGWDPLCLLEFHDRMATSTLKLYQLEKRCMPAFLQSDEAITAIGGYGKRLLLGTNQGRLYRFLEIDSGGRESGESAPSIQWIIESKAELPASTVKDGDAIKQLVCASALGILFCTTGSGSMHTLDLESLEPLDGVGIAKDTPLESSSDDPFSIQLALVNIRKTQPPRILLAIQHADGERDVWERIDLAKWADYDGTASVRALCYSGHTLCYASEQAYYLRDLKTGSNLKLLNYTLMGAMQPLIVSGGAGQFCFTAPGHLAVFVDERGSSTHPPINLSIAIDVGLELLAMELKGASMLVVLDERECLSLYGLGESKWSETIHCFDDGRPSLLANVEGALLVVTSGGEVGEIVVAPLIPQIEAAITDGRFAEALRMVDYESAILLHIQEVYRGDEEKSFALLYQLRELKTKIAYGCMGVGCEEWSRIRNLLIECVADPSELLARYPELSNHAQGSQRAEAGLPSYAELRDYLEALLSESWAQLYLTKITEGLAKLHYLVGDDNGIAIRAEWNSEELRQWLVDKDRYVEAAKLYCDSGDGLSKALSLWRQLASSKFIDKSFNFDECVEHLRQVPADCLLEKIDELDWLIDSRPKETAELIDAALMRSKPGVDSEKTISKVVEALRSHLATRLDFLERWIHLTNNVSLHNLLFSLMLNALSTEGSGSHEEGRLKLRRFLIGPHLQRTHYDVDYVARKLRSGQLSDPSVELSLLNATESNCVALMEELLGRGELAAAELLCYKFPSDEALTLLLGNLNSSMCSADSGQRDEACHHKVLSILEAMSTSDFDVAGLIASRVDLIPPDIPSRAFVSRVLLPSVTKYLAAEGENRMWRELTESVKRRNRSRLLDRLSTTSVSLDPDSCCQACHRPLTLFVNAGDSGIAMNPTNGKMFHQQCLDTKHGEERCVP